MAKNEGRCRLPVTHPDFFYVDSKNPYWTKLREIQGDGAYLDGETERHAGEWRRLVPDAQAAMKDAQKSSRLEGGTPDSAAPRGTLRASLIAGSALDPASPSRRPLHVEICCNGGHVTLGWAARDPKAAYIGIDWKFKQIYFAWEKAKKRDIHNTIFLRARGERIDRVFAEGEIDHLSLYFPDPWPKKAHHKHRFITPDFLARAAKAVREGGTFHIKTDHRGYFEWIQGAVAESGRFWKVVEETTDLHSGHPDPESLQIPDVTLFERIFIRDGIPINSIRLERI